MLFLPSCVSAFKRRSFPWVSSTVRGEGQSAAPLICVQKKPSHFARISHLIWVRLMSVNLKDDYYEGRLFNGLLNRGMPPEGSMLLTKREKKNLSLNSIGSSTLKAEGGTLYYRPVTTCYMEQGWGVVYVIKIWKKQKGKTGLPWKKIKWNLVYFYEFLKTGQ